jgi:hypothetical protein
MTNLPEHRDNPKPNCPKPRKRRYPTRAAAQQVIDSARLDPNGRLPVASYLCVCGCWHLAGARHYGRRQ